MALWKINNLASQANDILHKISCNVSVTLMNALYSQLYCQGHLAADIDEYH